MPVRLAGGCSISLWAVGDMRSFGMSPLVDDVTNRWELHGCQQRRSVVMMRTLGTSSRCALIVVSLAVMISACGSDDPESLDAAVDREVPLSSPPVTESELGHCRPIGGD